MGNTHVSKKKGNKWKIDEFFNTGVREIDAIMKYVESLSMNILKRKVLDFGCGVGRLTQPLANYFDEVCGVDIAPSMIDLAKKYNHHGNKCRYYLNTTNDLKLFDNDSFDFIYTNIVLQHMEPRYSKDYLKEFIRILNPKGLLIFQLPEGQVQTLNQLKKLIKTILPPPVLLSLYFKLKYSTDSVMEMYGIKKDELIVFLEECDVKIIDIVQDQSSGKDWVSYRYCVMKNTHVA